eukprot:928393-Alexandrium_andersonii.AAC.1
MRRSSGSRSRSLVRCRLHLLRLTLMLLISTTRQLSLLVGQSLAPSTAHVMQRWVVAVPNGG